MLMRLNRNFIFLRLFAWCGHVSIFGRCIDCVVMSFGGGVFELAAAQLLILAAENGHADCMCMLIAAGAEMEFKDEVCVFGKCLF